MKEMSDAGVVLACMGRLLANVVGHETGAVMEGALHKSARDAMRGVAGKE